jgi:hypothetical protein
MQHYKLNIRQAKIALACSLNQMYQGKFAAARGPAKIFLPG